MLFKSQLMQAVGTRPPDTLVLSDSETLEMTAGQLISEVQALAGAYQSLRATGIAVAMDNSPAWVVADLAAMESDLWTLPLPPFFTQAQRDNATDKSGCSHVISDTPPTDPSIAHVVELAGKTLYITELSTPSSAVFIQPKTAKITFTSGSTGDPKGICLSLQNMMNTAKGVAQRMENLQIEQHVSILPLAVLLENVAGVYAALLVGVPCVVPSLQLSGIAAQPIPDSDKLVHLLDRHPQHSCILVPELLKGICHVLRASDTPDPLKSRFIAVGGARVGAGLLELAQECQLPVFEGYGLSEACSVVSLNTPDCHRQGSAGKLLNHQRVLLADDGELLLKDPGFLGYCGDNTPVSNPLPTGDLCSIDEQGYLSVNGRKKNTLITSMGRNVAPEWIESELSAEPTLAQVMVRCDDKVQLCALVVSPHDDELVAADINRANSRLPAYAQISRWDRVPMFSQAQGTLTGNGKIRREAIEQLYGRAATDSAAAAF